MPARRGLPEKTVFGLAITADDGGKVLAALAAQTHRLVQLLSHGAQYHRLMRLTRSVARTLSISSAPKPPVYPRDAGAVSTMPGHGL